MLTVKYVPYQQIDRKKWDDCIAHADNQLIYACSFYLDAMAENWDALVMGDYETVMPLTWKRKYRIHYLYQPFFTAALGVFGKNVTNETVSSFLTAVPEKFRYWDFYLNHGNCFSLKDFDLYERVNYVLPLDESYEKLQSRYRGNVKRNIKKSVQLGNVVKKNFAVDDVIAIAKEQSKKFSPVGEDDYVRFKKLYQLLHQSGKAAAYGISSSSGQLVASAVFFLWKGRAYYILVGNHPNGKTIGASHALIDAFIKDHAGKNLLLDFEGSDIRNLAFFYSSFGATEEKYSAIKLNRLPKIVRLLKK